MTDAVPGHVNVAIARIVAACVFATLSGKLQASARGASVAVISTRFVAEIYSKRAFARAFTSTTRWAGGQRALTCAVVRAADGIFEHVLSCSAMSKFQPAKRRSLYREGSPIVVTRSVADRRNNGEVLLGLFGQQPLLSRGGGLLLPRQPPPSVVLSQV